MIVRGDIVRAKETLRLGGVNSITENVSYVVCEVVRDENGTYIRVLGDDKRGHDFLADLFVNESQKGSAEK